MCMGWKSHLTTAPIVRDLKWQQPFEVMCDANDLAIGAVLEQREDGNPYVVYYATKMKVRETILPQRRNF